MKGLLIKRPSMQGIVAILLVSVVLALLLDRIVAKQETAISDSPAFRQIPPPGTNATSGDKFDPPPLPAAPVLQGAT